MTSKKVSKYLDRHLTYHKGDINTFPKIDYFHVCIPVPDGTSQIIRNDEHHFEAHWHLTDKQKAIHPELSIANSLQIHKGE